jgi:hypothetical protein
VEAGGMMDHQYKTILCWLGLLLFSLLALVIVLIVGFSEGIKAIRNLKPTMSITQNPTIVKVIDGPRPTGLLPGVEKESRK